MSAPQKKFSPIPFLILVGLAGFAFLMWLGNWQLNRQVWKDQIIKNMEEAHTKKPTPISEITEENVADYAFKHVHVKGTWGTGPNYFIVGRTHNKRPGYHLFNIVKLSNGNNLMVNVGWVAHKNFMQKSFFQADLIGRIRKGDQPGWLSPSHKPGIQEWTSVDLEEMGNAIGAKILPYYVDYVRDDKGRPPFPIPHILKINNQHLGYSITWFSLGGIWIIMFIMLIIRTKRDEKEEGHLPLGRDL